MLESILLLQSSGVALLITVALSSVAISMAYMNIRALKKQRRGQQVRHKRLQEDMRALSKSAIGMGQKIMESERRLNDVLKKQFSILNSQPEHPSYDQASHLIAMGATEKDLVNTCGFSHGEAELLLSLKRQSQPAASHVH
ncbi:MAG: DUF2802 domain-containing protein [Bermanella sp.]